MKRNDRRSAAGLLLLAFVVLIGLNLRPFLTVIGPLASNIREATGLSYQSMSLLTLVPMTIMGICAFAGPSLQRHVGSRWSVIGALTILGAGCILRLFTSNGIALIGTAALCGLGVAIVQAVFPSIIKERFPGRVAVVMGLYSSMLMGGGALGAQLSPIIANTAGNWHAGLAWLVIPAAVAALMSAIVLPRVGSQVSGAVSITTLLRRPRTWLLMICFGLVNGGYSSIIAWLASFYQELGWTAAASGSLLATMAISQAISALLMPALAERRRDRRPWIFLTLSMEIAGFAGLAFWPQISPTGLVVLVGAGLGGSFALFMVLALDHIEDATNAGALSALMQGGGFLIGALPPWIVAVLHDQTGSFAPGWFMHFVSAVTVAGLTIRFAPHGYVQSMKMPIAAGRSTAD